MAPWKKSFMGYSAATRVAPEWTPAYLVFQGGIPRRPTASMVGPGQIYAHEFGGPFLPVIKGYVPGVLSAVGPGMFPNLPPYLMPLLGGQRGQGS